MSKKIIQKDKKTSKSGLFAERRWEAHRLEGIIKNKAIKPIKKKKKIRIEEKPLDKNHNPDKISLR